MNLTWLGIVVLVLIAGACITGFQKGFVKEVVATFFVLFSIIISGALNPYVSSFLRERKPVYNIVKEKAPVVNALGMTLGVNRTGRMKLLIYEMRVGITTAVVSGFGRAISEVGAVMIVGGNIKGKTRVMTTYISELKGMGDYERAIAVGLILLLIAFTVNAVLYHFQERESR